jgi:hypothetical protein
MLRNLLRRISERAPTQEEPPQIRRGSSSSEQKQQHAYRENQEVLGKGAIAQVRSAHFRCLCQAICTKAAVRPADVAVHCQSPVCSSIVACGPSSGL